MVKYESENLDKTFAALADPTRRAIMFQLSRGEQTVTELAEPFDMSMAAVSKHIRILANADLIIQRREGRIRKCSLQSDTLRNASQWMDYYKQFWSGALDSLEQYLDAGAAGKGSDKK
ncbi:MAG: ArsR/SmtB family transcription factor [Methyloligellaceae bacterium]